MQEHGKRRVLTIEWTLFHVMDAHAAGAVGEAVRPEADRFVGG